MKKYLLVLLMALLMPVFALSEVVSGDVYIRGVCDPIEVLAGSELTITLEDALLRR
jgi:hypothetical protein